MTKIGVIGVGRLGLCLALNLEKAGFEVIGVDLDLEKIALINDKRSGNIEPQVDELLAEARHFHVSDNFQSLVNCEQLFVCVATPSLPNGTFDHTFIHEACNELMKLESTFTRVDLIITSTVMPGFCDELQMRLNNSPFMVSYNPEFIAQGSIIRDQQLPDQLLIGEADHFAGELIEQLRRKIIKKECTINRLSRVEAEISKLAVNCFLTTKIAFANSIGDLTLKLGGSESKVLNAIGSDRRIGRKFLRYGFGFGGPCLPRDNRALEKSAEAHDLKLPISTATDESNQLHLDFMVELWKSKYSKEEVIVFEQLSYKLDSDILEESQQLELAVLLARDGYSILVRERAMVVQKLKTLFDDLFTYEIRE